jgi:cysteine desulfurase
MGIPFHTDLVQCVGRNHFQLNKQPVSTATLSFHKVGGPKGVGLLYIRPGTCLQSVLRGGGQERKRRAGTENVLAICGAEALVEECRSLEKIFEENIKPLRNQFESELKKVHPKISVVGERAERLPNTSFIIFPGMKSDRLLMSLDFKGICLSSGSACSSGLVIPSRSLLALGYSEADAMSAIRFSLGAETPREEIPQVVAAVQASVLKLAA